MRLRASAAGLWLFCIAHALPAAQPAAPPVAAPAPSPETIRAIVLNLRNDPNLGKQYRTRTLHWSQSNAPPPKSGPEPPTWIVSLFEWMAQATSALFWIGGALAVAIVAVWIWRVRGLNATADTAPQPLLRTHLGDLDLRPSSLPDDVGATALALLQSGRLREALSLLYRGALSRAVHRYGVTIGESFTESEALQAADARLDAERAGYLRDVVSVWQRTVYAGQAVADDTVATLCAHFAPILDGAPP